MFWHTDGSRSWPPAFALALVPFAEFRQIASDLQNSAKVPAPLRYYARGSALVHHIKAEHVTERI